MGSGTGVSEMASFFLSDGCKRGWVTSDGACTGQGLAKESWSRSKVKISECFTQPRRCPRTSCRPRPVFGSQKRHQSVGIKLLWNIENRWLGYKHVSVFTSGITCWTALPAIYIFLWVLGIPRISPCDGRLLSVQIFMWVSALEYLSIYSSLNNLPLGAAALFLAMRNTSSRMHIGPEQRC